VSGRKTGAKNVFKTTLENKFVAILDGLKTVQGG